MNIIFEATTYNHKLYHNLVNNFSKETKKKIKYGIIRYDKIAKIYLDKQNEIKYTFFEDTSGLNHLLKSHRKKFIQLKKKLPKIDLKLLTEFEQSLDEKSIWKIVSSDRFLGRSFLTGVIGYDNEFSNDRDFILRVFTAKIKSIENIFLEFKPDIFLPMVAGGSIEVFIYKYLCKKYNVLYAIHFDLRTKNYFSYTDKLNYTFPFIEKDTELNLKSMHKNIYTVDAENMFNEIINNLDKNNYFNIETKKLSVNGKLPIFFYLLKIFLGLFKNFFTFINKKNSFRDYFLSKLQNVWLPNLGNSIIGHQKYIYYPLHSNPEYSTSIMGVMFQDQITVIEALAKSIPHDWVVYVKEHPGVMVSRIRPYKMYKRIMSLPNVQIAPVYEETNKIIQHSEMVAVVTGTAGWEAILRNKPVIHFVDVFYQCLGLSKKCSDLNLLSNIIREEYLRIEKITNLERKKRIVAFFASFIKNGFNSKYPQQLLLENGTDEEYLNAGNQLAVELIKYINKIDPNFLNKFK